MLNIKATGLLTIVTFISLGFIMRKLGLINKKVTSIVTKLVIYVLLPFSALNAFIKTKVSKNLLNLATFGITVDLAELFLFFVITRDKDIKKEEKGIMMVASSSMNTGLFGLPFFEAFYGNEGVATALLLDIGNSLYLFMIAYALLSAINETESKRVSKAIINGFRSIVTMPYIWGLILGIIMSNYSIEIYQLNSIISILSSLTSPLILITTGANLTDLKIDLKKTREIWIIKFFLGFIVGYIAKNVLGLRDIEGKAAMMYSVLPPPFMTVIYAELFNLDTEFASQIVTFGLFLGFIAITLVANLV